MFLPGLSVYIHRIDKERSIFLPGLSVSIHRIDTKRSMFLPGLSVYIQRIDTKRIMFLQVCLFISRLRIDTRRIMFLPGLSVYIQIENWHKTDVFCFCQVGIATELTQNVLCFCQVGLSTELTQNVNYVSAGLSVYIQAENWDKTYYVPARSVCLYIMRRAYLTSDYSELHPAVTQAALTAAHTAV